jgi:hypothetical protein
MIERVPLIEYIDSKLTAQPFGLLFSLGLLYLGAAAGIGITQMQLIPSFSPVTYLIIYGVVGSTLTTVSVFNHILRCRQ